ncbi:MAG: tetratricopeptide repeat protein [Pseudomonadota bacterium]
MRALLVLGYACGCACVVALVSAGAWLVPVSAASDPLQELQQRLIRLQKSGDHNNALRVGIQIVEVVRARYGEAHPIYAEALNNLALVQDVAGLHEKAEATYRDAIRILTTALGRRHPQVAVVTNNLAAAVLLQCKLELARRLYLRSANILTRAYGVTHRDARMAVNNFKRVSRALGLHDPAAIKKRDLKTTGWQLRVPKASNDEVTIPPRCTT